ncbi:hypothetical protein EFE10_04170 [Leuconostoc citreum]|nr:hypothetical protein [Leuconostoc citreum]
MIYFFAGLVSEYIILFTLYFPILKVILAATKYSGKKVIFLVITPSLKINIASFLAQLVKKRCISIGNKITTTTENKNRCSIKGKNIFKIAIIRPHNINKYIK